MLLATAVGADERDRVIGLASFIRLRDPRLAEVSFIVADDRQADGIATRLLEQIADEAGRVGIERFVAEVLPENRPMLRVFEDSGFEVSRTDDGEEVRVDFPIRFDERYLEAVDFRDHTAVGPSLRPVLEPDSVVLRDRQDTLERMLDEKGTISRNDLNSFIPDGDIEAERTAERTALVKR